MSRLTSPLPNPSNHKSRLCCCKMSQPMFQTFCLLKFYIRYFWCAVTLDTKWQTNRDKILTPHLITFHFENLCEHRFSCETRTSVCLDGGLNGWWCVEKRVARTLRVFLSKNPFPATARPTGPNVAEGARTYSLVRILQLFSAHRIHVQPSPIVHSHCFCILGCPFDMEAHQSSNKEGVCFFE